MMNGFNVDVNGMDATQRHHGMDWNSDPNLFRENPLFGLHVVDTPQHTNPNTAGALIIRNYLDITPNDYGTSPDIIVRDVASGCAYPAAYALNTLQIVANGATGNAWMDSAQVSLHKEYGGALPDGSYVAVNIPPLLAGAGSVTFPLSNTLNAAHSLHKRLLPIRERGTAVHEPVVSRSQWNYSR